MSLTKRSKTIVIKKKKEEELIKIQIATIFLNCKPIEWMHPINSYLLKSFNAQFLFFLSQITHDNFW